MRTRAVLWTIASLLMAGCHSDGGDGGVIENSITTTEMILTASASSVETGQQVSVTLRASHPGGFIASRLDFDGDGTWDVSRAYSRAVTIAETFTHSYPSEGAYTIRAEVVDSRNETMARSTQVTAVVPAPRPVSASAYVSGRFVNPADGPQCRCYADGPPMIEVDSVRLRSDSLLSHGLGSYMRGSSVTVTQAFHQETYMTGDVFRCGCTYHLGLLAETSSGTTPLGSGQCSTTSLATDDPAALQCSVTMTVTVP